VPAPSIGAAWRCEIPPVGAGTDTERQQRHHAPIVEAQRRDALIRDGLRLGDLIEHPRGKGAILADGFHREQTATGSAADGPHGGQVFQELFTAEVVGVVARGLGAQGALFGEVLLDLGGLVADLQRGDDPLGHDAGVEGSRRAFGDPPLEDQADFRRVTQIEVLPDDLLEEMACGQGPVEDLGPGELRLQKLCRVAWIILRSFLTTWRKQDEHANPNHPAR
jgi:hypothetical protein